MNESPCTITKYINCCALFSEKTIIMSFLYVCPCILDVCADTVHGLNVSIPRLHHSIYLCIVESPFI